MKAQNSTMDVEVEIVEAGGRERAPLPGRSRALVLGLVLVLAVAVGAAALWEHRDAERNLVVLRACVDRGDAAVADADRRVTSISNYVLPSLSPDMDRATRDSIFQIIAQTAQTTLPGLTDARAACRAVPVRSWRGTHRDARTAYVAYLDDVLAAQQAVARRGQAIYAGRETANQQRDAAELVLRRLFR